MVLNYDAYNETIEENKQRELELKDLKERLQAVQEEQDQKFNQIMVLLQKNPKLVNIKPEILVEKTAI
jgi:regulator of replication initiation timing